MSTAAVGERSKTRLRRILVRIAAAVAGLYAIAFAGFYCAMRQPPETFGNVMKHTGPAPFLLFPFETMWKTARAGNLSIGDFAPDFTLPLLDRATNVTLSSLRGDSPVVLVFGSYT